MRDLEVILSIDASLSETDVPYGDATSGVSSEQSACIAEFEAVGVHLIENSARRCRHSLLIGSFVLHLHLWSHD